MIPARVLVSYGSHGIVSTEQGNFDCRWRRGKGRPLCGDQILVSLSTKEEAALEKIEARQSEFRRGDARGRAQLIAANVQQVIIVVAPEPAPSEFMIDRYLVAVAAMGLKAVLVLNKCDLLKTNSTLPQRLEAYKALGVEMVRASSQGEPGTDAVAEALHQRHSILVGQSGAGKSSLINSIIPDREEQTGALSEATGKGRHTTTRTLWIQLPNGGAVVDSPGVWEYGLWHMEATEVQQCMPDIQDASAQCRFRNCLHQGEPGCGVADAIHQGSLPQRRLDAFHNILSMQKNNK
ncbi:MAG: ribosome small subunit-dependent GTPase A [Xanthomonadales bacterium]|jgi:ribosome biogenesis GTPase|nr:ribosome small subunit-dependent GTPase A [Xanthomonadales bacterium]